jgi:hypothetical protein
MNITEIRKNYPEYNDISDEDLTIKLQSVHKKSYPDMNDSVFESALTGRKQRTFPALTTQTNEVSAFEKDLPENVGGAIGTAIGSLAGPYGALAGSVIGQGGGKFLQEAVQRADAINDPQTTPKSWSDIGYETGQAAKRGLVFHGIGLAAQPVVDVVAPVIKSQISRPFKYVKNKIISKITPEAIPEGAKIQGLIKDTATRTPNLSPEQIENAGITVGMASVGKFPRKIEAATSHAFGGGAVEAQKQEVLAPIYEQIVKETGEEVGGKLAKIVSPTEFGNEVYNATNKAMTGFNEKVKATYAIPKETIAKAGLADKSIIDITPTLQIGEARAAEGKLYGGLGAKGKGDAIAGKLGKVMPSPKTGKGAAEVEKMIRSSFGKTSGRELYQSMKNNPDAVSRGLQSGLFTEADMVDDIMGSALKKAGLGDAKNLTFKQYEDLRQRLVLEFEDATAAIAGESQPLKQFASELFDSLDASASQAAIDNGVPDAARQIERARALFSAGKKRYATDTGRRILQELDKNPERAMEFIVSNNGLKTLRNAKKIMGEDATGIINDFKKTIYNDAWEKSQVFDPIRNRKITNPFDFRKNLENRLNSEMKKEVFNPKELDSIETMLRTGGIVDAAPAIGQIGSLMIPVAQATTAMGAIKGLATHPIRSSIMGAVVFAPETAAKIMTNQKYVNTILGIANEKLPQSQKMVLLEKLYNMFIADPAISNGVRMVYSGNREQENPFTNAKTQPLQKAGNQ